MASLRDEIQADLVEAFQVDLDDIPRPCTYTSLAGANPSYNPDNGIITRPQDTVFYFDPVFTGIVESLKDDVPVQEKDMLMIFPSSYMTIEPRINDTVLDENNVIFAVVAGVNDPAQAHYELHIRPIS